MLCLIECKHATKSGQFIFYSFVTLMLFFLSRDLETTYGGLGRLLGLLMIRSQFAHAPSSSATSKAPRALDPLIEVSFSSNVLFALKDNPLFSYSPTPCFCFTKNIFCATQDIEEDLNDWFQVMAAVSAVISQKIQEVMTSMSLYICRGNRGKSAHFECEFAAGHERSFYLPSLASCRICIKCSFLPWTSPMHSSRLSLL
jgi:hypothetical protein